jgi:putative hydrolase of HD superfamily
MSQINNFSTGILEFYKLAEVLKRTLRHSWLSDGVRQESVAEHSWMMALLALAVLPHISQKLNQEKVLMMIIVHDLAEAVTQDMPVWDGVLDKQAKFDREKDAMKKIVALLDLQTQNKLLEIWEEYEERTTAEAKFVKVIDTLDVIVQHNVAPTETWDDNDYLWQLSPLQNKFFDFDETLQKIKVELDTWSIEKATMAGGLEKLDQEELQKRK